MQAEHWRREKESHVESNHQDLEELEALRNENTTLKQEKQKLQDRVERQQVQPCLFPHAKLVFRCSL